MGLMRKHSKGGMLKGPIIKPDSNVDCVRFSESELEIVTYDTLSGEAFNAGFEDVLETRQ
jgi:hypothetical protein